MKGDLGKIGTFLLACVFFGMVWRFAFKKKHARTS